MEFIRQFSSIGKNDVGMAGGKGASLGEMTRLFGGKARSNPVPAGFVVLASAFDRFLDATDLGVEIAARLHQVKHTDVNSVDRASNEIRDLILDAKFPRDLARLALRHFAGLGSPLVAVRSSATAEDSSVASWAGELESYLNTTRSTLLVNIQQCWASLFTPRAIFYRREKKLHKAQVSVAVVVQQMVQSVVSGICFTVHPVTKDYDQMVIEAGWGLGEAIVGGKITPDTYVVHKKSWELLDCNVSEQSLMIVRGPRGTVERPVPKVQQRRQKLTGPQMLEIARLCQRIERHYRKPQDIEWARAKGKFFIVQSRPITTL